MKIKYLELIENNLISSTYGKLNKKFQELKVNDKNIQELKRDDGKYVGEIVNGLSEGRGICYFINGDRYEGEWKNNKKEGKGIYYFNNGDRYEGEYKNGNKEGKGIYYFNNGNKYEGNYKNDQK